MDSPLLECLPPEVIYRRVPLPDEENALPLWLAAAKLLPSDDAWNRCEQVAAEACETDDCAPCQPRSLGFSSPERLARGKERLEQQRPALELIDEGLARGKLQVPLSGTPYDPRDYYWPRALFWLARLRGRVAAEDGNASLATNACIACLRFADMICNGDGNTLHYVFGTAMRTEAANDLIKYAARLACDDRTLAASAEALQANLDGPDGYAGALRVMLCDEFLPHLERMPEAGGLDALLLALLKNYYDKWPQSSPPSEDREGDDAWRDYRRETLALLLESHPRPFDKRDTARLVGEEALRRIARSDGPRQGAQHRRLWPANLVRNAAARLGIYRSPELWPLPLTPSFSLRSLLHMRGEYARRRLLAHWRAEARLPSRAALDRHRRRLLAVENPVGRLIASSATIPGFELGLRSRATRRAGLLIVALRRHSLRLGRLPTDLVELVRVGLLREIPLDPYSGRPLKYCPRRRIVWSVGDDGRDYGGKEGRPFQSGTDIVYRLSPAEHA